MKPETEMQKKEYVPAVLEIIRLSAEDILTVSVTNPACMGIDLPIEPFGP